MSDALPMSSAANVDPHYSNVTNSQVGITDVLQVPSNDLHQNFDVTSPECFDNTTTYAYPTSDVIHNISCEKFYMHKGRNKKFAMHVHWNS